MRICLLPLIVMFFINSPLGAADFAIVKDGKAVSRIVLANDSGAVAKHAARELAIFIHKTTGVDLEVSTIPSKKLYNIYLGTIKTKNIPRNSSTTKAMSKLKDDGFLLAADHNGLQIIGKKPIGVLYGVYEGLKLYMGIRWFAPGSDFEHCPKVSTVLIPERTTIHNPVFKFRYIGFICSNSTSKTVDTWDWMVRNGMTIRVPKYLYKLYPVILAARGAEVLGGGHCFYTLLPDSEYEHHPEAFALINGKRVKQFDSKNHFLSQPCCTSKIFLKSAVDGIDKYLNSPPKGGVYLIGNNDVQGWCECPNCVALDTDEEKKRNLVNTRFFTTVNRITEGVLKTHPNADIWSWAYQNFQFPPKGVTINPKLCIEICPHGRCCRHSLSDLKCKANIRYRKMLSEWMKIPLRGTLTYEYHYSESFSDKPPYLPIEKVICDDLRYYKKIGLSGFVYHISPPDGVYGKQWRNVHTLKAWYAQWQRLYMAALYSWNVNLDFNSATNDMNKIYYGEAYQPMSEYRKLLISGYSALSGHITYGTPYIVQGKLLEVPGLETRLLALLGKAEKLAKGNPVNLQRVRMDKKFFHQWWQALHDEYLIKLGKSVHARRRVGKITIDGQIDEKAWAGTTSISDFMMTDRKTPASPRTFVKLLYDKKYVYIAVEAMELSPKKMKVMINERDGNLWSDNSLEFFLVAPNMKGGEYCQIVVNNNGIYYDALSTGQSHDRSFDSKIELKTRVLGDRWLAELRIPMAVLGYAYKNGGKWKINIARNRRLIDGSKQSSSWSNGVFHGPGAFRTVVFGSK